MPVKEISVGEVSLNFHENDGSEVLSLVEDDFRLESLDPCVDDPVVYVVSGLHQLFPSLSLPILGSVEPLAHVLDADVLLQRGEGGFCELLLNEGLAGVGVKLR